MQTPLALRKAPDPVLHQVATRVTSFGPSLPPLVQEMRRVMKKHGGIGLAAPQVGVSLQILMVDVPMRGGRAQHVLLNPEITEYKSVPLLDYEGCLSLPGITLRIARWALVTVKAQDLQGKTVQIHASGLLSRCLQHEIDHLQGCLITDRLQAQKKAPPAQEHSRLLTPVA